jgi:hypothetical protein
MANDRTYMTVGDLIGYLKQMQRDSPLGKNTPVRISTDAEHLYYVTYAGLASGADLFGVVAAHWPTEDQLPALRTRVVSNAVSWRLSG